ncbi:unnamed protein product [Paramecium pentaurelia]|uniref:F-BAR domain-containing protein n=1 Tax=Paramecium pentaurelia TaxID=43138 RepID=A0A8S1V427_9CILI|nr:unnamed protein product [Paramecium pentaurelia]
MQQNYAELLFSYFTQVANQSQTGRKIIEEIIDLFEERANLEEKYAKSLEKLVANIGKLDEKSQMYKVPIFCLKSLTSSRQYQAQSLCTQIREDLITQLRQVIQQQNGTSKKLIEEAKKMEKENLLLNQEFKRSFQDYKQKKREYEQYATVLVVYNLLSEYSEKKRINQYYKVNQIKKEYLDLEQQYKQSVFEYNSNCENSKTRMQEILNIMQEQEEKRIGIFQDTLIRQIIFEVSHSKNVQYDLEKITEVINEIQPKDEVAKFINNVKQEGPNLFEKTEIVHLNSFISNSLQRFFQKEFDELLNLNNDESVNDIIANIEQGTDVLPEDQKQQETYYAAKLINDCWKEEEISIQVFQELKKKTKDNYQLRMLIIVAIQNKRLNTQFKLGSIAFQNVLKLFNSLLEICLDTFDAGTSRQLMNLSFTFYQEKIENNKTKCYFLSNEFAQHQVWENRDLWETSIIQQIYEKIKDQQQKQRLQNQNDQIQVEKNMILTILTQMAQNMLLFNFKIGALKDIMYKFLAFFELNEEITYDLFNAIEGFEKQKKINDALEKEAQFQKIQEQIQKAQQENKKD